jgi:hypothetical protein
MISIFKIAFAVFKIAFAVFVNEISNFAIVISVYKLGGLAQTFAKAERPVYWIK